MNIEAKCPNCNRFIMVYIDLTGEAPPNTAEKKCPLCETTTTWTVHWTYNVWLGDTLPIHPSPPKD